MHTDEFLESRARKRESGRVEQRRLERRLDKVCSTAILECLLVDIILDDTDLFIFYFYILQLTAHRFALPESYDDRKPKWTKNQYLISTATLTTRFQFL